MIDVRKADFDGVDLMSKKRNNKTAEVSGLGDRIKDVGIKWLILILVVGFINFVFLGSFIIGLFWFIGTIIYLYKTDLLALIIFWPIKTIIGLVKK
jgi:hypothetical protein